MARPRKVSKSRSTAPAPATIQAPTSDGTAEARVNVFNVKARRKARTRLARLKVTSAIHVAKPPYRIPGLAEIRSHRTESGYKAISTFSGGGGSSTGYEWAGFEVAWASEFVEEARRTYRANHPGTIVDGRDIRQVTAEDILAATGLKEGELDLFDGSPPCASFSLSGKREEGWGRAKSYSDTTQRTDDLFLEYARLVEGVRPKVFIAENVAGLVSGLAKGYFQRIMARLKGIGYAVEARVLDASRLGVPQARRRLFVMGVREDLGLAPSFPAPLPYVYTVADAWAATMKDDEKVWCDRYVLGKLWAEIRPGDKHPRRMNLARLAWDAPSKTLVQTMGNASGKVKYAGNIMHPSECRYPTLAEARRLCSFPDDYTLTGAFAVAWERLGRAVPPLMARAMGLCARRILDEHKTRTTLDA